MEFEPIIKVDKLVKTYDGNNVVDGVSFEVKRARYLEFLVLTARAKHQRWKCWKRSDQLMAVWLQLTA